MADRGLAAVILAAGKGTRLNSALTKVLHPVVGRPCLHHVLAALAPLGAERTIIVASPENEAALAAAAPAACCVIQSARRGTADAVLAAKAALAGFVGDVLVLFGDSPLIRSETLAALAARRAAADDPAVVVLGVRLAEPAGFGRLILDSDGGLARIVEEADASEAERAETLCNAAFMAIDGAVLFELLDAIGDDNAQGEFYLTGIAAAARARGRMVAVVEGEEAEMIGIDSRAKLADAEAAAQRRLRRAALDRGVTMADPETVWLSHDTELGADVTIEPSVFFGPGVKVHPGVTIRAFSHLEGCEIETGAVIGPFARLRPESHIGEGARIGNFVEVKKTTVEAGAKANHLAYLGDTRVGAGANIGAGTITCNYDGVSKFETNIGAGAFIGSNTALVAPVSVGDGAIVGAGSTITKDVPADAIAVSRAEQNNRAGVARAFRESRKARQAKQAKRDQDG